MPSENPRTNSKGFLPTDGCNGASGDQVPGAAWRRPLIQCFSRTVQERTQTINNFQVNAGALLVYGIHAPNGFDLGSTDNALNPLATNAIDPAIFIANASCTFTSSGQRSAYNAANGNLFYSATGSNTSETTVVAFTNEPSLTASSILFSINCAARSIIVRSPLSPCPSRVVRGFGAPVVIRPKPWPGGRARAAARLGHTVC